MVSSEATFLAVTETVEGISWIGGRDQAYFDNGYYANKTDLNVQAMGLDYVVVNRIFYRLCLAPAQSTAPSNAWNIAAEAYAHQPRSRFGRRERHLTFEWISNHSNAILQRMEKPNRRRVDAAWRQATETWLRCQGLISVSLNQKVLPHLPLSWVHQ